MSSRRLRIGIDARNDGTGVGRYTFSLVRELARIDRENCYTLFVNRERLASYSPPGPNFRTVEADVPWFSLREQLVLPRLIDRERLDLVHYPNATVPLLSSTPFVVTIHDLNYLDRGAVFAPARGPESARQALLQAGYRLELAKVRRARRLIAVSEHTRDAMVRVLRVDPGRIGVTYEAAGEPESLGPDRTVVDRHGLDEPFFLYVGAAYPYKNVGRLIEAFGTFVNRVPGDHRLVLAGDHEQFGAPLKVRAGALGLGERVVFPGLVSDSELAALYDAALAYVFVSWSEGFGLPGLEAMRAGLPVVAAQAASLPEVYGDAARYCDPLDIESIASALADVATDEGLRRRLVALGLERAGEFSWARTAEQTLAVYTKALLD
jgi:glycosyltransferase involved in cell wall biosynthesis